MRKSQQISTFYTRRKNTSSNNICKVCKLLIQCLIRHLEIRPHCAAVYYNNNNNTNDKCKVAEKNYTNSRYTSTTANIDLQDSNESHLVNDNSRKNQDTALNVDFDSNKEQNNNQQSDQLNNNQYFQTIFDDDDDVDINKYQQALIKDHFNDDSRIDLLEMY